MAAYIDISGIFTHDHNFQTIMCNMLQKALDISFEGVMITEASPGYPIIYVNPALCDLTGYAVNELLGKSPAMLQGKNTDPEVLDELREKIEIGEVFHGQTMNYRKDGSEFVMEWKIVPIRNKDNIITHYLAIQREAISQEIDFAPLHTKLPF